MPPADAADRAAADQARARVRATCLADALRMIAEAVKNGTHAKLTTDYCGGCCRMRGPVYHVTEGGVRLCAECADGIGQGPQSHERRMNAAKQSTAGTRTAQQGTRRPAGTDARHGSRAVMDDRFVLNRPSPPRVAATQSLNV